MSRVTLGSRVLPNRYGGGDNSPNVLPAFGGRSWGLCRVSSNGSILSALSSGNVPSKSQSYALGGDNGVWGAKKKACKNCTSLR